MDGREATCREPPAGRTLGAAALALAVVVVTAEAADELAGTLAAGNGAATFAVRALGGIAGVAAARFACDRVVTTYRPRAVLATLVVASAMFALFSWGWLGMAGSVDSFGRNAAVVAAASVLFGRMSR